MPPKAEKKPTTAGKAPAGKAPAEKKEAGKKTAAPTGDKKKRSKTRKETYSSYIYKGNILTCSMFANCLASFGMRNIGRRGYVFLRVDGCLTWSLHVICCSSYVEVMLMHPSRILICFDALHLLC
jgi:hypothetical protein